MEGVKRTKYCHIAYMAGLFDGEGCIVIERQKARHTYQLKCLLGMLNEYIPQLFHFNFGCKVYQRKRLLNGRQAEYWYWQIASQQAYKFLKSIYPHIIIKKPQAEVGIRFVEEHIYTRGVKLNQGQIALKEADAILIKKLKERK